MAFPILRWWILVFVLFLGFSGPAFAVEMRNSTQSSGGSQSSAGYRLWFTVGEPSEGRSVGPSFTIWLGFLPGVGDPTPPTTPVVTDDGDVTNDRTRLHASWNSLDPESGIAEYQYRITQDSPEGSTVVDWTSVGTATEATRTGLRLLHGRRYYFGVKARNGEGSWSSVGYSDGIDYISNTAPRLEITSPEDGSWVGGGP